MSEKQKADALICMITAAMLPMEIEAELIGFVKSKCHEEGKANGFLAGAEFMRGMAVGTVSKLEEGCLGIQKAAFVASRNAIMDIQIVGIG